MASITDRPSVPAASSDQTVTGVTEQWPERAAGSSMAAAGASILVAASMGVASAGSAFAGSTMSRASGSNSRAAIKTVSAGIGIGCAQPLSLASDVPSSFKHASPAMPFITTAALAGIVRMQRKFRRQKKYGRCWEVVMPSSRSGSESGVSPFMKKGMLRQAANSADDHSSTNLDQSGVGRAPSELSSSSSAATDGEQGKPKLPAASDIPLSIVPVAGGKGGGSRFVTVVQPGSQVAITSAATWSSHGNVAELRQRLSPGIAIRRVYVIVPSAWRTMLVGSIWTSAQPHRGFMTARGRSRCVKGANYVCAFHFISCRNLLGMSASFSRGVPCYISGDCLAFKA